MSTLVAAYTLAWTLITTYVVWLGRRSKQLSRRLDDLGRMTKADPDESQFKHAA